MEDPSHVRPSSSSSSRNDTKMLKTTCFSLITDDLLHNILVRLPVKSFAWAACVSKSRNQVSSQVLSRPKLTSALSLNPSSQRSSIRYSRSQYGPTLAGDGDKGGIGEPGYLAASGFSSSSSSSSLSSGPQWLNLSFADEQPRVVIGNRRGREKKAVGAQCSIGKTGDVGEQMGEDRLPSACCTVN